jgi:hypothetical protein
MITIHEQQLSSMRLNSREASGGVAASYFERRHHQLPRDWPSAVSRFLDRGPGRNLPKPSAASQPLPRRRAA